MKTIAKIFALSVVILGFTTSTFAQGNSSFATATASGSIITPINITKAADMAFGNIVNVNNAGGTVTLAVGSSTPTYSGVTAFTGAAGGGAGTISTAKFDVTGNNSNTYAVSVTNLPTAVTITGGGSETMAIGSWTSNIVGATTITGTSGNGTRTLSSSGTDAIEIGATLTVGANQKAGSYTSSAFTVTVNYN